jgi:predicted transcriptional regulator
MRCSFIKRILVIDGNGNCSGVVSQKDIAERESASTVGEVAKQVMASA